MRRDKDDEETDLNCNHIIKSQILADAKKQIVWQQIERMILRFFSVAVVVVVAAHLSYVCCWDWSSRGNISSTSLLLNLLTAVEKVRRTSFLPHLSN